MDYLNTGEEAYGKRFIEALKKVAKENDQRIKDPDLAIFEGSLGLCMDKNGICVYSMGSATRERLKPRLERGEPIAIEIVVLFAAMVATDGAEAEQLNSTLAMLNRKQPKALATAKERYPSRPWQ